MSRSLDIREFEQAIEEPVIYAEDRYGGFGTDDDWYSYVVLPQPPKGWTMVEGGLEEYLTK